jgi:hypothetical protein
MAQSFSHQGIGPIAFESVSNVTATNSVELGTVRTYAGEEYVYVYNGGSASAPVGQAMVLSFNSGYTVTVSSVTGYDIAFGVVKHAAIGAGQYGWLLTRGFTTVTNGMASTALTAGDPIYLGAAGKAVAVAQTYTTALSQLTLLIGIAPFGYVVSGCASGGTGASQAQAYVRCWGS